VCRESRESPGGEITKPTRELKAQHAYRTKHSAQEAVKEVHGCPKKGLREVVEADLSGYFDTIPRAQLVKSLARRISDGAMLKLLKKSLQMPVEESDGAIRCAAKVEGRRKEHRSSYTKDNFEFRRVVSFQRNRFQRVRMQRKMA